MNYEAKRIGFVWYVYFAESLKNTTRGKRGLGIHRKVTLSSSLLIKCDDFLKNDKSKAELLDVMAEFAIESFDWAQIMTNIQNILKFSNQSTSTGKLLFNDSEEVDGHIIARTIDAITQGTRIVLIESTEADVLVLAIPYYFHLKDPDLVKLWIKYGKGNKSRYICVNTIAESMGKDRSIALKGFYAFSGYDTVSSFPSKGKLSAWQAWIEFGQVTDDFLYISKPILFIP